MEKEKNGSLDYSSPESCAMQALYSAWRDQTPPLLRGQWCD